MMRELMLSLLLASVFTLYGACDAESAHIPDVSQSEMIYLWDEGRMPAVTEYSVNRGSYFDDPGFRPNMVFVPAEGRPKGAVMVLPGGAFSFRSDEEGLPVAEEIAQNGYHAFIVNYRVRPYNMEESSLDLARAVRYVRAHADEYLIDSDHIAAVGFSAGGILAGNEALYWDGTTSPSRLDPGYTDDVLDSVSADLNSIGMIYSFYGRLSAASYDVQSFIDGNIPPTYFRYGTRDPFARQFPRNAEAVRQAGVEVEEHVMESWPHGFGARGGWVEDFCRFLDENM